jgi:hypothetical protein
MARPDPMLQRIEAFNRGGGVVVRRAANGYSLHSERSGGPVARFKPTARTTRSACWPGTVRNGAPVDRLASPTMTLDRALDYIASNPFF